MEDFGSRNRLMPRSCLLLFVLACSGSVISRKFYLQGWAEHDLKPSETVKNSRKCNADATFRNVLTMTGTSPDISKPRFACKDPRIRILSKRCFVLARLLCPTGPAASTFKLDTQPTCLTWYTTYLVAPFHTPCPLSLLSPPSALASRIARPSAEHLAKLHLLILSPHATCPSGRSLELGL